MSEHHQSRDRTAGQAVDRLLADAGLDEARDIRAELLELRSLASTSPAPSAAVRALMASSPVAATSQMTTADGPSALSTTPTAVLTTVGGLADEPAGEPRESGGFDELATRRRRKRRAAIAGLAVAVSLAGGATAAAASEGGIPGAFQDLGTAIGSVVSQLTPGAGHSSQPNGPAAPAGQQPGRDATPPYPAPATPKSTDVGKRANGASPQDGAAHSDSGKTPAGGLPQTPKGPGNGRPGNVTLPTPPVGPITPPNVDPPNLTPPSVGPSDIPVPDPTHLVPQVPAVPNNP